MRIAVLIVALLFTLDGAAREHALDGAAREHAGGVSGVGGAQGAQPGNGGGSGVAEKRIPPRKCVLKVHKVSKAVCSSRRQSVQICSGGGKPRIVVPQQCQ